MHKAIADFVAFAEREAAKHSDSADRVLAIAPAMRRLAREAALQFPPDMARVPAEPNQLSNQRLVHVFEEEWGKVQQ